MKKYSLSQAYSNELLNNVLFKPFPLIWDELTQFVIDSVYNDTHVSLNYSDITRESSYLKNSEGETYGMEFYAYVWVD